MITNIDSQDLISEYDDIAKHFFRHVFNLDYQDCVVTDESSLADFRLCIVDESEYMTNLMKEIDVKADSLSMSQDNSDAAWTTYVTVLEELLDPVVLARVHNVYGITMTDINQPLVQVFEFLQSYTNYFKVTRTLH